MACLEHFKKPPIFPSEEANRIRSRRNPRRPFSGRAGPWLGSCNQLSGLMSLPALWPGLACEAHAQGSGGILLKEGLQ